MTWNLGTGTYYRFGRENLTKLAYAPYKCWLASTAHLLFLVLFLVSILSAQNPSWKLCTTLPNGDKSRVITVDSNGKIYVGAQAGSMYTSIDNCATWTKAAGTPLVQPINGYAFTSLIIALDGTPVGGGSPLPWWYNGSAWVQGTGASTDLTMYMVRDNAGNIGGGITFSGQFNVSADNGRTWTVKTNTGGAVFSIYFARDGCYYVGGEVSGIHRSCDGGVTWQNLGLPTGGINDGANVHSIMEDAHGRIYAGCRGGLSRWSGSGTVWKDITSIPRRNAITGTGDINVRSVLRASNDWMFVATDSGIFRSIDNGNTFALWNGGVNQQSGASADRNQMAQDPVSGLVYIVAGADGIYQTTYPITAYNVQQDNFVSNRTAATGGSCNVPNPPSNCFIFQTWQNFSTPTFSFANNVMTVLFGNNDQPQLNFRGSKGGNFGHWVAPCVDTSGGCSYNQAFVTSGNFEPTLNSMTLDVTCNVSSAQANVGTANGVQGGIYTNAHTDETHGPPHYYWYWNPTFVNGHTLRFRGYRMPIHNNCCGGTDGYPVDPEFNAPTTPAGPFHFFDGFASMYWADDTGGFGCGRGNEGCNGAVTGKTCNFANFYYGVILNEPEAWTTPLEGSYGGTVSGAVSVDRYEVNFNAPKLIPHGVTYEFRYSTVNSLKVLGFLNGTDGGTVTSFDNLAYTNTRWQSSPIAQATKFWVAIRPRMPVASITNASPPVLTLVNSGSSPTGTLYHNFEDADLVTVRGFTGLADGNYYAHTVGLNPNQLSLYSNIGLTTPLGAGPYSCAVQCTVTSAMPNANMTEILISEASSTPAVLTITPEALPPSTIGASYSQSITGWVAGGLPPYSPFVIATGTLPGGLTLSSSGTISGNVSGAPGTFNFKPQVTDSAATVAVASTNASIVINAAPAITGSTPNGTVGVAYSATLTASPTGTLPDAWDISVGALPGGLAIDPATGAITGTPNAAGVFNFTVRVIDSVGIPATHAYTVTIASALQVTTLTIPTAVTTLAYNEQLTASGGVGGLTWDISAGSLTGSGISLNSAGLMSGTAATIGSYPFTARVTDSGGTKATKAFTLDVAQGTLIQNVTITVILLN